MRLSQAPHRAPLPSLLLANVRSLVHKMDELRLWITNNKRIMNTNIILITESWLNDGVPDSAIELQGLQFIRSDRTAEDCGKERGGGLLIYVNNSWCTDNVTLVKHCSADLEFVMIKSRPFYLPREFTSIITTAAYIPPDANAKNAMKVLYAAISKHNRHDTRSLSLLLLGISTIPALRLYSLNSTNMCHVPHVEIGPLTTFTPTSKTDTRPYPLLIWVSRTTYRCSYYPDISPSSGELSPRSRQ